METSFSVDLVTEESEVGWELVESYFRFLHFFIDRTTFLNSIWLRNGMLNESLTLSLHHQAHDFRPFPDVRLFTISGGSRV